MGLRTAVDFRINSLGVALDTTTIQNRPVEIVIQGTGLWVKRAIQPDLRQLHDDLKRRVPNSGGLYVSYIGLERDPVIEIDDSFETYYCRDDSEAIEEVAAAQI